MAIDRKNHVTNSEKSDKKSVSKKQNRTFSETLKRKIVSDLDKKHTNIKEVCDLYAVTRTSVYNWLVAYSTDYQRETKTVVQMESEAQKTKNLYAENQALLAALGRKQLELDYLHRLITVADEALATDLKKNFGTLPSMQYAPNKSVLPES